MMSSATPFCKGFLSFFLSFFHDNLRADGEEDVGGRQLEEDNEHMTAGQGDGHKDDMANMTTRIRIVMEW